MTFPIFGNDGLLHTVIQIQNKKKDAFSNFDNMFLQLIGWNCQLKLYEMIARKETTTLKRQDLETIRIAAEIST